MAPDNKEPESFAMSSKDTLEAGLTAHQEEKEEEDYPSASRLVFMIVALVLSMFLASLDMTIIGTAIPRITDEFHSLDQVRAVFHWG